MIAKAAIGAVVCALYWLAAGWHGVATAVVVCTCAEMFDRGLR